MAWVTFNSPLWKKDIVQEKIKPLPSLKIKRKMEQGFVNDGVHTKFATNRRKPIIPAYNAVRDRYAQAYFQSPLVKAMMERNFHLEKVDVTIKIIGQTHCASEHVVMVEHRYKNHEALVFKYSVFIMTLRVWEVENERAKKFPCNHGFLIRRLENLYGKPLGGQVQETLQNLKELRRSQANVRNLNKLSHRRRCKGTPTIEEIRAREHTFVNDAIITEKKRTKYKDIIPVYDASHDQHCLGYFKRPDVKHLISTTCTPTGSFSFDSKFKSPTRRQKMRASAP